MSEDLFARAVAPTRAGDPETSRAAAEAVTPAVRTIRAQVERFAVSKGPSGFIDEELSAEFASEETSSYRTRRDELVKAGAIADSGDRRTNSRGLDCVVWVHTSFRPDLANAAPPPSPARPRVSDLEREKARLVLAHFRQVAETQRRAGFTGLHKILVDGCDVLEPVVG